MSTYIISLKKQVLYVGIDVIWIQKYAPDKAEHRQEGLSGETCIYASI